MRAANRPDSHPQGPMNDTPTSPAKSVGGDADTGTKLPPIMRHWKSDVFRGTAAAERESQVQEQPQGHQEGPAKDNAPDPLQGYSREELEMEIAPMLLANVRQLATWYLLRVPALIEQIDQCEAMLHPDDVAGLIKREAAREFPCGRG